SYGIDILRYTETAQTVGTGSAAPEVLRSLGYWFFYGQDTYGPWIAASKEYTQNLGLLLLSYLLPIGSLIGAAVSRFRDRAFFALLVLTGMFLAVGAHPWAHPSPAGSVVKSFLLTAVGESMRSLPRAVPLLALGLAVFAGAGIGAIAAARPKLGRPLTAVAVLLAVIALPPLWTGKMVDSNLDRADDIPSYWKADIAALDAEGHSTRVLEVPGEDFASYRWGTTVDPITPGLMDRPYVARELIPYGSPPSADLLDAFDQQIQEGTLDPKAVAPMARFMGAGDINVRSDITYERYNTPRPRLLWGFLRSAPGLGQPQGFGGTAPNVPRAKLPLEDETELATPPSLPNPPQVAILPVKGAEDIVRTASATDPVIVDGDGKGVVDASAAGLLTGHELLLYSPSYAKHEGDLHAQLAKGASLLVTDTNRKRAIRWGSVRENTGETERAGQKAMRYDPKDQRLDVFPDAGDDAHSVSQSSKGATVWAESTSYGNSVSLTPEDRAANAVDGNPDTGEHNTNTAWRTGGFASALGESIRVHYAKPVTTDRLQLVQPQGGVRNRFITQVKITFDGGHAITRQLDVGSRSPTGQVLSIPRRTFSTLQIQIAKTDVGVLPRYDGVSAVGFADIDVHPGHSGPVGDDEVRLPTDLLRAAGSASIHDPLTVLLTRERTAPTNAVRSDEEKSIQRQFTLPTARSFRLAGTIRLSNGATDDVIDRLLGMPDAAHGGITATSKRRIPGGFTSRASDAIDGNPNTWYSPGFLDQRNEFMDYQLAKPISF
ncbi:MAG TPA: alpha-(1-_3)-arabinofuranosyltransferase family protein, partial [Acidimicrobiales bacterium]